MGQPGDAATSDYTSSVVEYGTTADHAAAVTLARQVPSATVKLVPGLTAGAVQLILGSDFTAVGTKTTTASKPLGAITGSYKASSPCRNSAFFGPNLPEPSGKVSCACR